MMAHDPEGKMGPKMQLPDNVIVHEPKEENVMMMPPQDSRRSGVASCDSTQELERSCAAGG